MQPSPPPRRWQYFAWADTTGQAPSESLFNPGFSWDNCPFAATSNPTFNKYVPASATLYLAESFDGDTKTVLDLADDAAYVNWGGSWRMPTQAEFNALVSLKTGDFESGYNFGTADAKIFLPAAGYGHGTDLNDAGVGGNYWSSSLYTDDPYSTYSLLFNARNAFTGNDTRYDGQPVRALSE